MRIQIAPQMTVRMIWLVLYSSGLVLTPRLAAVTWEAANGTEAL
jgi:hypothetical protein